MSYPTSLLAGFARATSCVWLNTCVCVFCFLFVCVLFVERELVRERE
jgi:hypothetical protein